VAIQVQKRLKELEAADPLAQGNSPFGDMPMKMSWMKMSCPMS